MFYEERTQHGNAHRNLTVFSAFLLSALVSHPCLRSYNWALLLPSLPVVPDSSLFRHHFAVSGRSKQERHNFPWISSSPFVLLLPIYLLLFFTSLALSLPLRSFPRYRFIVWCHLGRKRPPRALRGSPHSAEVVDPDLGFPGQPLWLQTHAFAKVPPFLPSSGGSGFKVPRNTLRTPNASENRAQRGPPRACDCSWWDFREGTARSFHGASAYYYPAISSFCLDIWGKPWLCWFSTCFSKA